VSEPAVEVEAQTRRMVEEALAGSASAPPVEIVVAPGPTAGVLVDMSGEVDGRWRLPSPPRAHRVAQGALQVLIS
jgi:hypothetical protein